MPRLGMEAMRAACCRLFPVSSRDSAKVVLVNVTGPFLRLMKPGRYADATGRPQGIATHFCTTATETSPGSML